MYPRPRAGCLFDRAQVTEWAAERGLGSARGIPGTRQPSALTSRLRSRPLLRAGGVWRDVPGAEAPNVFGRIITGLPGATPAVRQLLAATDEGRGWRDDRADRRWVRPASPERAHHPRPRLRHGGVVVSARGACRWRSRLPIRAGHTIVFLRGALAARASESAREVEP